MRPRLSYLPALLAAAAAACSSDNHTGPATTGGLTVQITAPSGVTPAVSISGPSGYQQSLTATQTLSGLAPGSYAVSAANVTVSDPVVPTVDSGVVTGSPATIVAGAKTVTATVAYGPRVAGSGALWVANSNTGGTLGFTATQLHASGNPTPTYALAQSGTPAPLGIAVDPSGNVWMSNYAGSSVVKYTPAQLTAGGTPTPAVTLSGSSFNLPHGLAFDAQGNLWVANRSTGEIAEYTASQLTTSGTPTPSYVLYVNGSSPGPTAIAFDAQGNLWIANFYASTIDEYTASQLTTPCSPPPNVVISATNSSLLGPFAIAFDASGTLWVSNVSGPTGTIVGYSASQLTATGSPVPSVTITLPTTEPNAAIGFGLAFDASGQMWVSDALNNALDTFTATQLATSGSPTPTVVVNSTAINGPAGLAFDPHATTLPLH
jgi:sugar lactone lactonase YvrE